jgi:RNA polymerase sigma-70 factor (sigma-E family)
VQQALEQQYVQYVRARLADLSRVAFLLCGDAHRADDLVQQTITKLYMGWERISAVEHLDRYVRAMLLRVFLSERRTPWSRVRLFHQVPDPPAVPNGDVEERQVLRAALERLPRAQRAVLVLRFLCDLPVAEVAAALDCSAGTVKSHTSRGLATLRRRLGPQARSWATVSPYLERKP